MSNKLSNVLIFILLIVNCSCFDSYDYSPYVVNFPEKDRDIHRKNLRELIGNGRIPDDTIIIALTGDTHTFYDDVEAFVEKVNTFGYVDFVLHVGDLCDFGLPKQYLWGNNYFSKLDCPYFIVAGNHDMVSSGIDAFKQMFGPLDFSFIYNDVKFILINTNSMEFQFNEKVPDISWLQFEVRPDEFFSKAVVAFHVPPMDIDFDRKLEVPFQDAMLKYGNVIMAIHGHRHEHKTYTPYSGHIPYLNVYGVEQRKLNLVKIFNGGFLIETVDF